MRGIKLVAFLALLGCGASNQDVFGAVANTALGVTAAGVSRANGGCYAVCTNGTACNPNTGYCEALPCRGECRTDEYCANTPDGEMCRPTVERDEEPLPILTMPIGEPR